VFDVEEVWWVPTGRHAFGKPLPPIERREALCEAAIRPFGPRVRVVRAPEAPGEVSTSVELLERLSALHPGREFRLLLGSDLLPELPRFHRSEELLARWGIDVVGREGHGTPPPPARDLRISTVVLPDVSSTEVRRRLDAGLPCEHLVPAEVLRLLLD